MRSAGTTSRNWSHSSKRGASTGYSIEADKMLVLAVLSLIAAGLVMVYSSSYIFAQERYHDGFHFLYRHLIFLVLGSGAFWVGRRTPLSRFRKAVPIALGLAIVLLGVVFIPGLSHRAGGAARWISLPFFQIQPSELAKIAVILFVARQIEKKAERPAGIKSEFLAYFLGVIPIYLLLLLQPDFGTVALLFCATIGMLWACGARLRYVALTVGSLTPIALGLIYSSPYRRARVLGFLDPWSDPAHKGFQIIQSFLAFHSGKWLGVGLGNSKEKLFYLPEAHNDFIFAVVGEELGLLGVVFFVTLYLVVILRSLTAASRTDDLYAKAVASGIACTVGLQAFFNMAVVLGLLPTKGLPLPLVSYGGSSLITTLFMLGVVTRISEGPA